MPEGQKSKAGKLARDEGLILGLPKRLGSNQVLVNGTEYTATSAMALLQTRVTAATNVVTARAALLAALKAADVVENTTAATVSGLVEAIYVAFGDDPAALADFKLPARKKASPLTPSASLAAAEKRKATRAARHTMGPKQKAAITGTVPAVTPAVTAPPVTGGGATQK